MNTIIMRSALVFHGHNPPPEVHSVVVDYGGRRVVTWSDVMAARRERQDRILRVKRSCIEVRAWKVWVGYFGSGLMGGWQAFVQNRDGQHWIDRDRRWLKPSLMKLFPLVLDFGDQHGGWHGDVWQRWKVGFAERFRRRTQLRKPLGVAYVWWTGDSRDQLRRI